MSVILITGGTGFIGSHVARNLLARSHTVVLLDVAVNETLIESIRDKVRIVKGDITNLTQLAETIKAFHVETIIHYAAMKSSVAEDDPQMAYKINFEGLWNIFDIARTMDLDAVVFASSVAAYGPNVSDTVKEDVYTLPNTLYGISKQLGEMLGLWFHRRYSIQFAAFRYGSVIGPGRSDGGASAYSSLVIQKPAQGEPYMVNVPADSRIPILYVKDAVDATVTACERIEHLKTRIYNLASLIPSPPAQDIATAVKRHIPEAKITFKPDLKTTEIIRSWPKDLDTTRARNELGWNPKYGSLDTLVSDFIGGVQRHPSRYRI